jgi:hypothetical protein
MDGKKQTGKPAGTEVFTETREGSRKETGVHAGFADWDCRGAAYLNDMRKQYADTADH